MYSSRVPRRASRVWGTLLFCNLVLASIRASNLSILPRLSLDASRVPGLVFLFTLMLASKRVSNSSTHPSRVSRRADRVRGALLFCRFILSYKRASKNNFLIESILTLFSKEHFALYNYYFVLCLFFMLILYLFRCIIYTKDTSAIDCKHYKKGGNFNGKKAYHQKIVVLSMRYRDSDCRNSSCKCCCYLSFNC